MSKAAEKPTFPEAVEALEQVVKNWFVDNEEIDTIEIEGSDDWVKIKSILTVKDLEKITNNSIKYELEQISSNGQQRLGQRQGSRKNQQMKTTVNSSIVAYLDVAIVAWSFKNSDGTPREVNATNIGKMKPELALFLQEEINSRNPL